MKNFIVMLAVLGFIGFSAVQSFADSKEPVNAGNKICPISGEKIGEGDMASHTETVEYKGKVYNLCCGMCKGEFTKDPEAAIKKLEEKEAK